MKIVILDYGMGNIRSIISALKHLGGISVCVSHAANELKTADKLILPGVGAFGKAMESLRQKNLDEQLKYLVLDKKKPILGICLGMQLFAKSSNENGFHEGLGLIDTEIKRLQTKGLKIPHVGFNQVSINPGLRLYQGMLGSPDFYFTHSYRMVDNISLNTATCSYGEIFAASFEKENMAGVQFHPELSQTNGLRLINNFLTTF